MDRMMYKVVYLLIKMYLFLLMDKIKSKFGMLDWIQLKKYE